MRFARGELTYRPPRVFETITVEHTFTGIRLDRAAIQRATALAEERYCGASAMLSKAAHITFTLIFVERDEDTRA
jgi:putative redox protein